MVPFGRVRTGAKRPYAAIEFMEVIGAFIEGETYLEEGESVLTTGALVRSGLAITRRWCACDGSRYGAYGDLSFAGEDVFGICPQHSKPRVALGAVLRAERAERPERWQVHHWHDVPEQWVECSYLPLIVLAGLR
jgi:hypothetical protein